MAVGQRSKAKPACPLHLKHSGPSSDVQLAHWGAPPHPGPSASSSSSVATPFAAPLQGEVVRACEGVWGVPCNLCVAGNQAAQQNAAADGAVLIAQVEAAHWDHGMVIDASAAAAIWASLTAAAASQAAPVGESREAEAAGREAAAAREARAAQEAVAKKSAEVKALEQALAQERGTKRGGDEAPSGRREAGCHRDHATEGR